MGHGGGFMAIWLSRAGSPSETVRRMLYPVREKRWWWVPALLIPFNAPIIVALWWGFADPSSHPVQAHGAAAQIVGWCLGPLVMGRMLRSLCLDVVERRTPRMVLFTLVGLLTATGCIVIVTGTLTPPTDAVTTRLAVALGSGGEYIWRKLGAALGIILAWGSLLSESRAWERIERLWREPDSPVRAAALRAVVARQNQAVGGHIALVDPTAWVRQLTASAEFGDTQNTIGLFAQGVPRYRDLPVALAGFECAAEVTQELAGDAGLRWLLKYVVATCGRAPVAQEAAKRLAALPTGK